LQGKTSEFSKELLDQKTTIHDLLLDKQSSETYHNAEARFVESAINMNADKFRRNHIKKTGVQIFDFLVRWKIGYETVHDWTLQTLINKESGLLGFERREEGYLRALTNTLHALETEKGEIKTPEALKDLHHQATPEFDEFFRRGKFGLPGRRYINLNKYTATEDGLKALLTRVDDPLVGFRKLKISLTFLNDDAPPCWDTTAYTVGAKDSDISRTISAIREKLEDPNSLAKLVSQVNHDGTVSEEAEDEQLTLPISDNYHCWYPF
jgi:hypothetical protein